MHTHDGDDELLGTLRQVGVDFAKPRELNFYFLFPGEAEADRARGARLGRDQHEAVSTSSFAWGPGRLTCTGCGMA